MNKLTSNTREAMIDILATSESNSWQDYDTSDYYDTIRSGLKGLDNYSDEELLDEYKAHVVDNFEFTTIDPQLSALQSLYMVMKSEQDKAEVLGYINARLAILNGVSQVPRALTEEEQKERDVWTSALKEMGM